MSQNKRIRRKRRVTSESLCSCGHFGCDHMASRDTPAHRKIQKRLREGKCMGCGNKPEECSCKRTEPIDYSIPLAREKEYFRNKFG